MDKTLAGTEFNPWAAVRLAGLRLFFLLAAILVYGLSGTPTPDAPGIVEVLVGALLLLAAGGWQVFALFRRTGGEAWERAALALLLYGLPVPLLVGAMVGNDPVLMVRDIIAFLFLLLPLFLLPAVQGSAGRPLVTATVAASGVLFSLRALLWVLEERVADTAYLANAPTVLFAALLLLGFAGQALWRGIGEKNFVMAAGLGLAACIPLAAMALATQRASIAIAILVTCLLAAAGLVLRPRRVILPLVLLGIGLWLGRDLIGLAVQELMVKNALVGLNMRWQEADAVFDEMAGSVFAVLFGKGWGAVYASPAVGGMTVNFTHSFITTYLLKTGLCGLFLALIYLMALALKLAPLLFRNPVLALAILGPFAINVFLYASFKSLDFGLLLFLIPLWADRRHSLHNGTGCSNH